MGSRAGYTLCTILFFPFLFQQSLRGDKLKLNNMTDNPLYGLLVFDHIMQWNGGCYVSKDKLEKGEEEKEDADIEHYTIFL